MKIQSQHFHFIQTAGRVEETDRGILLEIEDETLRVDILQPDLIRLKISRGGRFEETPSVAVCSQPKTIPSFEVKDQSDAVLLTTDAMRLRIGKAPFHLTATRKDGSLILDTAIEKDGASRAYGTLNDAFLLKRNCERDDAFLGLGEKTGPLNHKGSNWTLWNTDILNPTSTGEFKDGLAKDNPRSDPSSTAFDPYYISIPFFYHLNQTSGEAAGFFIDNPYRAHYRMGASETFQIHFTGGQYTEYIFSGPEIPEILHDYTRLTGNMEVPPLWALGHHQCRWHKYDHQALLELAQEYRERGIPCDVLWLDIDYMDGYRVFTWDKDLFPDPAAMLAELKEKGFRVITIIDPGVKHERGYPVFEDGLKKDVFCKTRSGTIYNGQVWPGRTAFVDYSREDGQAWWGEYCTEHVKAGLAGIWNDMNEPATGSIPAGDMCFDHGQAPHEKYHNQFATLMAKATVDGLHKGMPGLRTFVLSRAGSPGIQRYAANWMGDNFSRWEHLWMSIPMAMGLGLSGQPFVGADVGGFADDAAPELLARWYQYGALTPFFRNHNCNGNIDQYPWSFGAATESIIRDAIRMRYRLMPYIYSAFMEAAETGRPIQRPLVCDYQEDRSVRDADDQYLFGPHMLVAPVYTPGCIKRPVYLPDGDWYDWFSGECHPGGQTIHADTPPDHIPVFVRAGAVIPQWPESPESTMDYTADAAELHVFLPTEDSRINSWFHEDDGITFAFKDGSYLRTEFHVERNGPLTTINVVTSGNGYQEHSRTRFDVVFHGLHQGTIKVNDLQVPVKDNTITIKKPQRDFLIEVE